MAESGNLFVNPGNRLRISRVPHIDMNVIFGYFECSSIAA
jgi:hypothetical protein